MADKLPVPYKNLKARAKFHEPASMQKLGLTITSDKECNDANQLHFRLQSELTCLEDLHISLHRTSLYIAILYIKFVGSGSHKRFGLVHTGQTRLTSQV